MSLTVVIPTRGVSPDLRPSVEYAIRSAVHTGLDAEVLVVVNGRDSAPALDRIDSPLLRVLFLDRANVARARNVGIAEAKHDTVLFGDDGGACDQTWCSDLGSALRDPRYPVVTAPVRVPVTGAVTAYLNHQRVFDAPPVDGIEAQTITGNCGIRRDLLPVTLRFDEVNLPLVSEDVAFGQSLRAAGIPIRWLSGTKPGLHLLSDRLDEITARMMRYGRGGALLWSRHHGEGPAPADMLPLYRYLGSEAYRAYRRFNEVLAPSVRAAFALYDYLYDATYLVGYLDELGRELDHKFIELDEEALLAELRDIAARAEADARHLSAADWSAYPTDLRLLDSGARTHDPLVEDLKRALARHAALVPTDSPVVADATPAAPPDTGPLREAWSTLRASGEPIGADELDLRGRSLGYRYRDACATIERAAARSARAA